MLQRTISILLGAPLLLVLLVVSPWTFTAAIAALTLMALHEFYGACRHREEDPAAGFGYAAALVILAAAVPLLDPPGAGSGPALLAGPNSTLLFFFGISVLLIASLCSELARPQRAPLRNLAPTWFGVVYIGWLFAFGARLRWLDGPALQRIGWSRTGMVGVLERLDAGSAVLLFVLFTTWTVDTAAYLVGKGFGRHKMAPVLSPGKTWEGAVGGFVGALLVAAGMGRLLGLPLAFSLTAGLLTGVLAQLGDLCKSSIKREVGVKDFGAMIPGHGGALDRFDSFLFTATATYFQILLWPG